MRPLIVGVVLILVAAFLQEVVFAPKSQVPTAAVTLKPTPVPTLPAPTPMPTLDAPRTALLRSYFLDGFGTGTWKTSWYDSISSVEVRDGRAIVRTNLNALRDGRYLAEPICTAIVGFAYGPSGAGLHHAVVYDAQGYLLYPECIRQPGS